MISLCNIIHLPETLNIAIKNNIPVLLSDNTKAINNVYLDLPSCLTINVIYLIQYHV